MLAPRGGRVLAFRCGAPYPRGGCAAPPTASGRYKVCAIPAAGGPRVGGAACPRSGGGPPSRASPTSAARPPPASPPPPPPRGPPASVLARVGPLPPVLGGYRGHSFAGGPRVRARAGGRFARPWAAGRPPARVSAAAARGAVGRFFRPPPSARARVGRARSVGVGGFPVLVRLCRVAVPSVCRGGSSLPCGAKVTAGLSRSSASAPERLSASFFVVGGAVGLGWRCRRSGVAVPSVWGGGAVGLSVILVRVLVTTGKRPALARVY